MSEVLIVKEEKVTIRTLIEYGLCVIVWGYVFFQAILKKNMMSHYSVLSYISFV